MARFTAIPTLLVGGQILKRPQLRTFEQNKSRLFPLGEISAVGGKSLWPCHISHDDLRDGSMSLQQYLALSYPYKSPLNRPIHHARHGYELEQLEQ